MKEEDTRFISSIDARLPARNTFREFAASSDAWREHTRDVRGEGERHTADRGYPTGASRGLRQRPNSGQRRRPRDRSSTECPILFAPDSPQHFGSSAETAGRWVGRVKFQLMLDALYPADA